MIRILAVIPVLMMLAGCTLDDVIGALRGGGSQSQAACPELRPAPPAAIDALEAAARVDVATGNWIVDLSQFYSSQAD